MVDRVQMHGIKEFQASLREIDAGLPKQIRVILNASAGVVLDYAKPKIPARTGAARSSVKARSSQRAVRVVVGGRKAPYYPWLDFGGKTGPERSVERPFFKEGRYLYPALRVKRDELARVAETGLSDLATSAGLEVT